jgi:hypothetical protein
MGGQTRHGVNSRLNECAVAAISCLGIGIGLFAQTHQNTLRVALLRAVIALTDRMFGRDPEDFS